MPDYKTMQQEAIKRAIDMQNRARQNQPPSNPPVKQEASKEKSEPAPEMKESLFDILFKDSEKTLILILILLLSSEECDASLIFALLYIVL